MKVNVYDINVAMYGTYGQEIVARVNYNSRLDYWDGGDWRNGGVGMHKGITRLRDGQYVIIVGSDWQGERPYAYTVTDREALEEILLSGNDELLDKPGFAPLRELAATLELEMAV